MGAHKRHKTDSDVHLKNCHQGLIRGILHVLPFQQCRHAGRMLPHRRNKRHGHPSSTMVDEYVDAKKEKSPVEEDSGLPTSRTQYEMYTKHHIQSLASPTQSGGVETISTHCPELLNQDLLIEVGLSTKNRASNCKNSKEDQSKNSPECNKQENEAISMQKLENEEEKLTERKLMEVNTSADKPNDLLDYLAANKELYEKTHKVASHNTKVELAKSGSFPLAGSSGRRRVRTIKLIKQRSIGPYWDHFSAGNTEFGKFFSESNSLKGKDRNASFSKLSDVSSDADLGHSVISCKRTHRRKNLRALKHFKSLRKNIKHIIAANRNGNSHITKDAVLHKVPVGSNFFDEQSRSPASSYGSNHFILTSKNGVHSMRRASSLKESMDKYYQLFQSSFNREATHAHPISERLRVRTDERYSCTTVHKSLRRISSSPELESFLVQSEDYRSVYSFQTEKITQELHTEVPSKIEEPSDADLVTDGTSNSVNESDQLTPMNHSLDGEEKNLTKPSTSILSEPYLTNEAIGSIIEETEDKEFIRFQIEMEDEFEYDIVFEQAPDYVLSQDLCRDEGWMNPHLERECVGLEIESMIFNNLLSEALWNT